MIESLLYWLIGACALAYYIVLRIYIRHGVDGGWMLIVVGLAFLAAGFILLRGSTPHWVRIAFRALVALGVAFVLALEGLVFSGMNARLPADVDALIVLGARVKQDGSESLALQHRIDSAAKYLKNNPDTLCIASGGQGDDEPCTEAEAIRSGLVRRGIDEDRILLEDQSTTTQQNLRFSQALLPESARRVGIVTNNFHVFRALALARKLGYHRPMGEAASFTSLALPFFMLREGAALVLEFLRGNL